MTLGRFRAILASVVGMLVVLTLAVLAVGDRTEPIPRSVAPTDGEPNVPASSSIVLRFGRPVDLATVDQFITIEPPISGSWTVERGLARFVPFGGLTSATEYTITVRAGFADTSGRSLRHDVRYRFETRPARLVVSRHEDGVTDVLAPRNLWTVSPDGQSPRQITREPLGILFAAVSPDGERVAYSAPDPTAPNAASLWIVRLDGTGRQKLAGDLDGAILSLTWSPRGDVIAYERRSVLSARGDLGRPRILAIRPDGGGGGLLFGRGEDSGSQPVWAPDGRRLLLADAAGRGRWIVDLAGEAVMVPGGGTDSGSWSPDGQQVAYADLVQEADGTRSVIRIARLEGTIVHDLQRPGYSDTAPAWSPDGRSIAVVGQHRDGDVAIWLLDPVGGLARRVPMPNNGPNVQITPPIWSAGGAMLAFTQIADVEGRGTTWRPLVVPCDVPSACVLPVSGLAEGWAP